jgi:phosphate transport system substrate-binding protein
MNKKLQILFALFILALTGCDSSGVSTTSTQTEVSTGTQSTSTPPAPEIDLEKIAKKYPRIDGSTSAQPLQVHLACTIFEIPCSWQEGWAIDSTIMRYAPDHGIDQSPRLLESINNINHSGTHGAYTNLIQGKTDFILVARAPSEDELQEARERGVEMDVQAVALDAFVFLVNAENPVEHLPLITIRDIYTGSISQWSDLSTGDGEIHTYQRNRNSGSQELMEKLVMRGADMIDSPDMILESMMGPINAIKDDPSGIGYSVYFYAKYIFPDDDVKILGIDGVLPAAHTIAEGSYPLTTEVFAVIREEMPPDHAAVHLRNWLLAEEGQEAIGESGYVPIHRPVNAS